MNYLLASTARHEVKVWDLGGCGRQCARAHAGAAASDLCGRVVGAGALGAGAARSAPRNGNWRLFVLTVPVTGAEPYIAAGRIDCYDRTRALTARRQRRRARSCGGSGGGGI